MINRIGFMQGRLSPLIDGKIQAFPAAYWQTEFEIGHQNQFSLIEWTLDSENLYLNPLMTAAGQSKIHALSKEFDMTVYSLTGDCFMQNPFWKAKKTQINSLLENFRMVVRACSAVGIQIIVVPLVDNGRIENASQEKILIAMLEQELPLISSLNLKIAFESDFEPTRLARFIAKLDPRYFGVNYDVGNSASLGFNPRNEVAEYGDRILNVHIKDRLLGGTTVPLGTGSAMFEIVFDELAKVKYRGAYILQTARAANGDHLQVLCKYRDMTRTWLKKFDA